MLAKIRDTVNDLKRYHISVFKIFNKNTRYYVIRRDPPGAGFFSNYMYVLAHVQYAVARGYLPVIDMQNYKTLYNEKVKYRGTWNAWEYYFEQPNNVSLNEAYNSKNYILSDYIYHREYVPYSEENDEYLIDKDRLSVLNKALVRNVHIRKDIEEEIYKKWKEISKDQVILGVHYRGTDKRNVNVGHYMSPQLENFFKTIDRCLSEHPEISRIFLCTDEEPAIGLFRSRYKAVVCNECYRATDGSTCGVHNEDTDQEGHKYKLGEEVLKDAYMLGKCDYLVYSHSNVINAAIVISNDSYKERYLVRI